MAALAAILFVTSAHAITLDNGDLAYQPDGTMLGVLYQHYFSGDELYAKGQKISDNAKLTVDVTMLRGVWYRDWGESVGIVPQFLLPIGKARTGGALSAVDSTNGAGDLLLLLLSPAASKPRYLGCPQCIGCTRCNRARGREP